MEEGSELTSALGPQAPDPEPRRIRSGALGTPGRPAAPDPPATHVTKTPARHASPPGRACRSDVASSRPPRRAPAARAGYPRAARALVDQVPSGFPSWSSHQCRLPPATNRPQLHSRTVSIHSRGSAWSSLTCPPRVSGPRLTRRGLPVPLVRREAVGLGTRSQGRAQRERSDPLTVGGPMVGARAVRSAAEYTRRSASGASKSERPKGTLHPNPKSSF